MSGSTPKKIIVLGATGSIGKQTLDIVSARPADYTVVGMSAHSDARALCDSSRLFPGARLCLSSGLCSPAPNDAFPNIAYLGREGLFQLIKETDADIVVNGIAGSSGLEPSLIALESGKDLALANKETIVMAGRLVRAAALRAGRRVLPVDSEHAAVFRLIHAVGAADLAEIVLTASGGAFRDRPLADLERVTPEEACAHPTWSMGLKITVDSATMANKGLEVIEAARLFDVAPDRIKVVIHPQSVVHSFVRTRDGALYAQLSEPDMRGPILAALSWPDCPVSGYGILDLDGLTLEFRQPDSDRYPLLGLAYEALAAGEGATIAYNAANEVAVAAFLSGDLNYLEIARVVQRVLNQPWPAVADDIGTVLRLDAEARAAAAAMKGIS